MKKTKSNVIPINVHKETWSVVTGYFSNDLCVEFSTKGRVKFIIENKEVILEFFDGIELIDKLVRCQQDLPQEVQSQ